MMMIRTLRRPHLKARQKPRRGFLRHHLGPTWLEKGNYVSPTVEARLLEILTDLLFCNRGRHFDG